MQLIGMNKMKITQEKYLELFVIMFSNYNRKGVYTLKNLFGEITNDLGLVLDHFKVDIIKPEEDVKFKATPLVNLVLTESKTNGTETSKKTTKTKEKATKVSSVVKVTKPKQKTAKEVTKK